MRLWGLLVAALAAVGSVSVAAACDAGSPCAVKDGAYSVRVPAGWDGRSPLPAVVFFHGYAGSAEGVMADQPLADALSNAGVLLVVPQGLARQGLERSWSFPGRPQTGRDDFAFVGQVLDDVEARWPIDRNRLLASGFSVGGSMTWFIACQMGHRFAGYAPIAGAFWAPEPQDCPTGPMSIRHVHGLADQTVPMAGRVLRGGAYRQGDVLRGIATWRRIDGCPETPTKDETRGTMQCRTWSAAACSSGREVVLCLHPGEHEIEAEWVLDGVRWLADLARSGRGAVAARTPN